MRDTFTKEEIQAAIKDGIKIVWLIDDVHAMASHQGLPPVSDEEAATILLMTKRAHDANYGITWDSLEAAYNAYHYNESSKKGISLRPYWIERAKRG